MDALLEGGVRVVEVSIRTQAAYEAMEIIKKRVPELIVGACNIKTPDMLERAIATGADYGTSPGNTERLLKAVYKKGHSLSYPVCQMVLTLCKLLNMDIQFKNSALRLH